MGLEKSMFSDELKEEKTLISVIIPTYNSELLIERCIYSVINNFEENEYEILVIDGDSSDATISIVKNLQLLNSKIKYVSEKDEGIYDAMNKGISLSRGNYIYFLGSDDEIMVKFQSLKENLLEEKVYYGDVVMKNTGALYDGKYVTNKLIQQNICHQSIIYHSRILKSNLYNLKYKLLADYELNLRLWKKVDFKYINKSIALYSNDGISTQIKDENFKKDFLFFIYKYLGIKYVLLKVFFTIIKRFQSE